MLSSAKCRACGGDTARYAPVKNGEGSYWLRCVTCAGWTNESSYEDVAKAYKKELFFHHLSMGWERLLAEQSENVSIWKSVLAGGRFLDVGFLDGSAMKRMHDAEFEVWGFDVSDTSVEFVAEKCGIPTSRFAVGPSLQACDLEAKWFDAIQCREVLEHVDDPNGLLREMARLLRQGGYLQVQTPAYTEGKNAVWDQPLHLSCFDSERLRTMVKSAGFEIVQAKYWDGGQLLMGKRDATSA
jgi:2-polyprenyl-3-methyl-5-hydroxy-6-metoxy-1,4-benzoquinol methylase